jgi:hypothetical protein
MSSTLLLRALVAPESPNKQKIAAAKAAGLAWRNSIMFVRRLTSSLFLAVAVVGFVAAPFGARAHESRTIADGSYHIVVGFMNEPVFVGDKSGLEFWVTDVSAATPSAGEEAEGVPVDGLEETLKAEVIFEDQTMELPLTAMWDEPGGYGSVFFPMEVGDYTFRIYGTIGDTEIDESFTSSPEGFDAVKDPAPLQFPKR